MSLIVEFPIKFWLLLALVKISSYFFKLVIVSRETRVILVNVAIWMVLSIYALFSFLEPFFTCESKI